MTAETVTDLLRRKILVGAAASAAALGADASARAASFGNPDASPEGRVNGRSRTSLGDIMPE